MGLGPRIYVKAMVYKTKQDDPREYTAGLFLFVGNCEAPFATISLRAVHPNKEDAELEARWLAEKLGGKLSPDKDEDGYSYWIIGGD